MLIDAQLFTVEILQRLFKSAFTLRFRLFLLGIFFFLFGR